MAGEKAYRCAPSGAAQRAPLGFYQDDFPFPRWQTSRDLSSPLQHANSSSSPKPKLGPAAGHYLGLEGLGDGALLASKQSGLNEKGADADGPSSGKTRKSQFEPLDLSIRPESVMSPAALVQMAGIFSNGLSSSITQQLQSYSKAAGELGVKPAYQPDLLAQGTRESRNAFERTERAAEDESGDAAKWKAAKSDGDTEEASQGEKNMRAFWGGGASDCPVSSLENLTPGQADHQQQQQQHQAGLLSFLRSQGGLSSTSAGAHRSSVNGGVEKDGASGEHPYRVYPTCGSGLFRLPVLKVSPAI